MCLNTLTKVLDGDLTGEASLELVRLLNRMIKELRFAVHPNVLTCLLHLRLKDELDVKSSMSRADRAEQATSTARRKDSRRKGENKFHPQTHRASKETAKAQKERKEIEEEMREAEAEVDQEDRSKTVCYIA
jgi:nucleolar complex protein 3